LDAAARIAVEFEEAQDAMRREHLDPADARLGLLVSIGQGHQESIGVRWFTDARTFVIGLNALSDHFTVVPLGIVWAVLDREINKGVMWAKPMVAGSDVAEKMKLARGLFKPPLST
jgi:hypothetical protein